VTLQHELPEDRDDLSRTEWFGLWPGTVVDTLDPEKRGRIRVRLDQVYGPAAREAGDQKIEDKALPWAQPCFPVSGLGGIYVVPPVGAGVWCSFWMGNASYPVWIGGWAGTGDTPPRFTSAYAGPPDVQPGTRIFKTPPTATAPDGHTIEMRWCPGEEELAISSGLGSSLRLIDAGALGGPKVSLTTPGNLEVTATGITHTVTLAGTLTLVAAILLALSSAAITFTAAVIGLIGVVALGIVGAKQRLVTENYFVLIQNPNVTAFNAHTHGGVTAGAGSTGPPSTAMTNGSAPNHTTTSTTAN